MLIDNNRLLWQKRFFAIICTKKPNCTFRDFNDVMLGSAAIFFNWRFTLNQDQQDILKTRGFPSPDYSGFGFSYVKIKQGI